MIVCHCKGISDRTIRKAVREGASTVQDVASRCGAGGGCGGCADAVHDLLHGEVSSRGSEVSPAALPAQPTT